MAFSFATCNRTNALNFLRKAYPSRDIQDTPDSAGPLLDLIEKDLIRVTDPDFHTPQIIAGKKWNGEDEAGIKAACQKFHDAVTA